MERKKFGKIKSFNQAPKHGANLRSGRPAPRRAAPWETSQAQSQSDRGALLMHVRLEDLAKRYPVFGNKSLPADNKKHEIIYQVENNKASSIDGDTGSGKSTQTAQYLYEAGYRVFHIVPKRSIADNLVDRISQEMSEHVDNADELVGVIHGDYVKTHENNKITIMTANTYLLMEKDIREEYGDSKVAIVCDETHESNLYVDVAMGVAAESVAQSDKWRTVAVSATQNQEAVARAFSKLTNKKVPNIHIEGRPHEMGIHERPDQSAAEVYADEGHNHEKSLIFTRGKGEIEHIISQTKKTLDERSVGASLNVDFRVLHAELTRTERRHVINDPTPEGKRVVIASTNFGNSGITIPGLTLVITDGTVNKNELDEEAVGGLVRDYLPQDGLMQQFGRAGRDVGGGVGFLVKPTVIHEDQLRAQDKDVDESMPFVPFSERKKFGSPEIYDSLLGQVALTIAALDRSFYAINGYLPNPVEGSRIIDAQEGLYRMGAMRPTDADEDDLFAISELGRKMSAFPIRPELSRGIVEAQGRGKSLKHIARVACIAAALEGGGLQDFSKDAGDEWKKLLRPTTKDDWIAQLDLMQALPGLGEKEVDEKFVTENDLSFRRVERAMSVARKILRELDITNPESIRGIQSNQNEEREAIMDLMAGMGDYIYEKVGIKYRRTMYRNIHGDENSTQRYASDRSVTSQSEHQLLAGWPRYFIQQKTGAKKDIVELIAPADKDAIAQYARRHDTFEKIATGSSVEGGMVKQRYVPMFGSLQIGGAELGLPGTVVSPEIKRVVVDHVLAHPGEAQTELRRVATTLDWLRKAVPESMLQAHKSEDSSRWLTNDMITREIERLAETYAEFHKIDQALGTFLRHNSFHVSKYFDEASYNLLLDSAPREIELSDRSYVQVQYESPSTPYVTVPKDNRMRSIMKNSNMKLPDGRDIYIKTSDSENRTIYLTKDQL